MSLPTNTHPRMASEPGKTPLHCNPPIITRIRALLDQAGNTRHRHKGHGTARPHRSSIEVRKITRGFSGYRLWLMVSVAGEQPQTPSQARANIERRHRCRLSIRACLNNGPHYNELQEAAPSQMLPIAPFCRTGKQSREASLQAAFGCIEWMIPLLTCY